MPELGEAAKVAKTTARTIKIFHAIARPFPHRTLCYPIGMFCGDIRINLPNIVFSAVMVASLAGLLLVPPIPQDQSYHQFADQRSIFGSRISGTLSRIFLSSQSVPWGFGGFVTIRQLSSFSWAYS
jgi:hypothetical protein